MTMTDIPEQPEKTAHEDRDPGNVEDHAFIPRDEWWSLCRICGLARAAHEEVSDEALDAEHRYSIGYYADDNPEVFD